MTESLVKLVVVFSLADATRRLMFRDGKNSAVIAATGTTSSTPEQHACCQLQLINERPSIVNGGTNKTGVGRLWRGLWCFLKV
jgi:hypothetical protein